LVVGTESTLTIENIKLSDQGFYYCEVGNSCALIETETVMLEVLPWSQTIPLPLKIGGFSTYLDLVDCDLPTVVAPIMNDLEYIEFIDEVYVPGGLPLCWDERKGAKASLLSESLPNELTVYGYPTLGFEIALPSGWSIMPVWSFGTVSADDIFGPMGSNLIIAISIDYSGAYWTAGGINSLKYLIPGSSYLVKLEAPGTVSFDVTNLNIPEVLAPMPENQTIWEDVTMTSNFHAISISKDVLATLNLGDIIGAFNQNGLIAGIAEITDMEENLLLRVFADNIFTTQVDGFVNGDRITFKAYRPRTGEEFDLNFEFDPGMPNTNDFEIRGMSKIISQKLTKTTNNDTGNGLNLKVYPNPSDEIINIEINAIADQIEVITLFGQVIITGDVDGKAFSVDISKLDSGMYLLKVITRDGVTVFKRILVK
jgi:hypothetical protein